MPLPSVDEARAVVLGAVQPLDAEVVPVAQADGRVLAQDVVAAADVPGFDNSAMDGFAVRSGPAGRRLALIGEARAGAPFAGTVGDREAVRISTGAALPAGADAVLQLELAEDHGDAVTLRDAVAPRRNVRDAGDDQRAGETVLRAGTRLGPAGCGIAVSAGRGTVRCARRPRVVVLATGDELREPGAPLAHGQVHDANGVTLAALARRAGAEVVHVGRAGDTEAATRAAIEDGLGRADVLLLSGGVSVGRHDHVKPALDAAGVEQLLWRVALRPGKPTWFGRHGATLVFGLPGNPVSAYVTFLLFARPALTALQGADPSVPRSRATMAVAVPRERHRDECVRVRHVGDGVVAPTGPQGSHVLTSLGDAEALAVVPRGEGDLPAGSTVLLEPV